MLTAARETAWTSFCSFAISGGPANEGMKQTKPAFFLDCAGFAAYPRCSADSLWPGHQRRWLGARTDVSPWRRPGRLHSRPPATVLVFTGHALANEEPTGVSLSSGTDVRSLGTALLITAGGCPLAGAGGSIAPSTASRAPAWLSFISTAIFSDRG